MYKEGQEKIRCDEMGFSGPMLSNLASVTNVNNIVNGAILPVSGPVVELDKISDYHILNSTMFTQNTYNE